ncbi:VWA domain-containing protein [Pleionea mediterranea]|uniref:VWA domain containing CoxE-like protein n=1 Tax=Pleionea mediterranea TaxID=523701 RepID=A0A316FT71_9GAMM|nr:VWA domain-containing protein [Pleionea mediterranea]PWK51779.1 VWA domain containing CoxE-like protein [Pleionea mediterranea]
MMNREVRRRWRLILGKESSSLQDGNQSQKLGSKDSMRDESLEYLYQREYKNRGDRSGGMEKGELAPATWLSRVRKVFPKTTTDYLQKQAIERYQLTQLLTDPEVLRKEKPNIDLVQTLLTFKNHLPEKTMVEVRRIIRTVCEELEQQLSQKVMTMFSSRRIRHKHGGHKQLNNMDWNASIRRSLKNYNQEYDSLILQQLYFYQRQNKQVPWDLYILVDQSGSMLSSIIHSAVLAAIFCGVGSLNTHLILFDTEVVDLTDQVGDPIENLLAVQLGGGTDIGYAVNYAASKVTNPKRSMFVVNSDFYEGGVTEVLYREIKNLKESEVHLLGLAALNNTDTPCYDEEIARVLVSLGMPVGAMTPDKLAQWVSDCMGAA